ncbi:hypothetical protein KY349_04930 [Candidatus Woesearchaeota archaeon]|nr:hypothetical protein [Candidatus Woesearchaeota archaeon]
MKYPENPQFHATVDGKTKELTSAQIDYNGVRVEVKTVDSQLDFLHNWDVSREILENESEELGAPKARFIPFYSVDFKNLEKIVGEKPKATRFDDPFNELDEDLLDINKVNLSNADARRNVSGKIVKYARWFRADQRKILEDFLKRCTTYESIASQVEAAESEPYHPDSFKPKTGYRPMGIFTKNR